MSENLSLMEIVEQSFNNAIRSTVDGVKTYEQLVRQWHSCALVAGCAAVRLAADGDLFKAAALEGVAVEAQRQRRELETVTEEAA